MNLCANWAIVLALSGLLAPTSRWGAPHLICQVDDTRVAESSGVAASRIMPGVFYTHNDSGDSARFFRFGREGRVGAVFSLGGIEAVDWEDMEAANVDSKPYLYFGDIGDNARNRASVWVYRLPEPRGDGRMISDFDKYELTYPDGSHDCETLMVRPGRGDIYLVTKDHGDGTWVYKVAKPPRSGKYALTRLGRIATKSSGPGGEMITGGSFSPDGKFAILTNYREGLEFRLDSRFDRWFRSAPAAIDLGQGPQREAVAYSIDGKVLLTTSEGVPCILTGSSLSK